MGRTTPHSVLAFHLVLTLCICPLLISGLDRKISPEDLKRGLERMAKAYSLYSNYGPKDVTNAIECVKDKCDESTKQLIIREVLMRNTFKFIDEACNTHNEEQIFLEAPDPNAVEDQPFVEKYFKWQDKVLDSGKIFCDPFKNLFCSSENKCACSRDPGRVREWKIGAKNLKFTFNGVPLTGDTCIIPQFERCRFGGYFDLQKFRKRPKLFDPLKNPQNLMWGTMETREPFCEPIDGCTKQFYDYFTDAYCYDDDIYKRINNVKKYFNEDVKGLKSGEECNYDGHNEVYKSKDFFVERLNVRLKAMESFQASGVGACDLEKFVTCGKSGKCECLKPTILDGAECELPVSRRTCENNKFVFVMMDGFVPAAQFLIVKGIKKQEMGGCGNISRCYIEIQNANGPNDMDMFCICKGFFTGQVCDEVLTLFLPFFHPTSFPIDEFDIAGKYKILSDFNKEAIKFQEKLKLKSGEKCDFYKELEIRRLIRRIDDLKDRSRGLFKENLEDLTKTISNFVQSGEEYCLRNLDPERRSLIEHSPYNQPIECEYSRRVCQTPLSAAGSHDQILASHKSILETHFSTLGCGEPCTRDIDYEFYEFRPMYPNPRGDIDRLENFLYDKITLCARSRDDVGAQINCETQLNGEKKCVCRGANCTSVCSSLKGSSTSSGLPEVATGPTNRGASRLAINGGTGLFLLFQFLAPFTLLIYSR